MTRVEDVEEDAFTEVMKTRKGKLVRADFNVVVGEEGERTLTWVQRVEGTPFASVLKSAETELRLTPWPHGAGPERAARAPTRTRATEVAIELRQEMASGSARYSPFLSIAPRWAGAWCAARRRRPSMRRSMAWSGSVADAASPPAMRWWGWGDPAHPPVLPAHALEWLRETVGLAERPRPPSPWRTCGCRGEAPTAGARGAARDPRRRACPRRARRARATRRRQGLSRPRAAARGRAGGSARRGALPRRARAAAGAARAVRAPFAGGRAVRRRHERRRRRGAAARRARRPCWRSTWAA